MRKLLRATLAGALLATGCTAVLGVNDVFYDPGAPQGTDGGGGGGADGGGGGSDGGGGGGDGGTSPDGGGTCNADLQKDAANCGRCGHSCGGGACNAGKCEAVELASVARVAGLATDGTFLYATSYSGSNVVKIDKAPGKNVNAVGSSISSPIGVAVGGGMLYVANENGASSNGGLHRCALPACTAFTRVTPLDFAHHVAVTASYVFTSSQDGVTRTNLDGTSPVMIANYTQAFGIVADDAYVYIGSFSSTLDRVLYDGGSPTEMGPRNASTSSGFIYLDGDRVFWAYEDNGSKKGQVLSSVRASPTTRTTYTGAGKISLGVAADAGFVYWADAGSVANNALVGDGTLNACPRAGCPASGPTVLATGLKGAGQIVLDADFVYFAENGTSDADGRVRKVAKP